MSYRSVIVLIVVLWSRVVAVLLSHVIEAPEQTCSARSQSCSGQRESAVDDEWNASIFSVIRDAEQKLSDPLSGQTCFQSQVHKDLSPWLETGITEQLLDSTRKYGLLYQVINGHLFREEKCPFPARCDGIDHFISKIVANLSNTEFVVNFHDWPQIATNGKHRTASSPPPPVFSFSKREQAYSDILFPAWSFVCGGPALDLYPNGIGQWDQFRDSISRNSGPWNSKVEVAFFRGSRTSPDRDGLILLSRSQGHVVDAQYTKNQAWRSLSDSLGVEPASTVSFESQCGFKYLVNMRGVAASFRFKHLFLCRSVVLNVQSDWIEFFYPFMRPWIHYVPIASDFSDLVAKVHFLRENDSVAKRIADRGYDFIWKHLTSESVECYWHHLLSQYTNLLKHDVRADRSLLRVS